jgi:hypothetical protein
VRYTSSGKCVPVRAWVWRSAWGVTVLERYARSLVFVIFAALILSPGVAAQGIYTSGWTGYDISWPQCDGPPPATSFYRFGVVGVTSGHAFRNNPCFAAQYGWATGGGMAPEAVYLNLNEDLGTTSTNGDTGPYGTCREGERCHALNYGYNAASSAYTYAAQVKTFAATLWWLDIETENSWAEDDLTRNQAIVEGAVRFLKEEHGYAVGVYSTQSMWHEITGEWQPGLPAWVGGGVKENPQAKCGVGFTGGPVWLVQYEDGDDDGDYACP